MPDTPVTGPPFVPVKPKISIGTAGSAVDIACAASDMAIEVDQDSTDWETFCGKGTIYGPELWTITVTVYPSYGTAGLWNLLRPLVGPPAKDFTILPDASVAASPSNPSMTGKALVKAFPFYVGAPGEPKTFDIELAVQGAPTWVLALTAGVEAADAEARGGVTAKVDVDWSPVTKATAQLVDGIESGARRTALDQATVTAQQIHAGLPVLTGRLLASVGATVDGDGAAVTYGGGVPYAGKIERRTHAVADALDGAPGEFHAAATTLAETEVGRL